MVIVRDVHRFEVTIDEHYGEWVAKLQEFVAGRHLPTLHLLRAFATRQDAIHALVRKWQVLFPDEPPLVWHEPPAIPARPRAERSRRRS